MGRARLGTLYRKTPNAVRWSGAFTHPVTKRRVLCGALFADKQASRAALDRLIREAERGAAGLESGDPAQRRRPVTDQVEEYLEHCRHERQAVRHIQVKTTHLRRLVRGTRASTIDDFTLDGAEAVLRYLLKESKISARTHNSHRATWLSFMNWLVGKGRISSHTFSRLPILDERCDRRRQRRALTEDELRRLLAVARWRPIAEYGRASVRVPLGERKGRRTWKRAPLTCAGLDDAVRRGRKALAKRPDVLERLDRLGRERELVYSVLLLTGLRKGELAALAVGDVHLDEQPEHVALRAEAEKSREGSELPLRPDLADRLRTWLAEKLRVLQAEARDRKAPIPMTLSPRERVVTVPTGLHVILGRDLRAAGIPRQDDRGYAVDVHALRHTYGTFLARSVLPRVAQAAMRHSDIRLTMNLYTDPRLLDIAGAVASLPRLPLQH